MNNIIALLNKESKLARKQLKEAELECSSFGMFDDCGDFYHDNVIQAKANLSAIIRIRALIKKKRLLNE